VKEITFFRESGGADTDWRQQANCRNLRDPDIFFPIGNTGPALDQIRAAKAICDSCIVRQQCLHWAIETNQDIGVWGGLSEDERKKARRELIRN
jgi:WhiB family redox-sensing transcriptional regulator